MNLIRRLNSFHFAGATLLLIILNVIRFVQSYPSFAGHCNSGSLANQSFGWHGNDGNGSLSNGGLTVNVGSYGYELSQLSPDSSFVIEPETTYFVHLNGRFKGFLFRLQSEDGFDVYDSFEDWYENVRRVPDGMCSPGVAAMSHDNRDLKTHITFKMNVPNFASTRTFKLRLDVTVVESNEGGSDDWYYDLFEIVVQSSGTSTLSPTVLPTSSAIGYPSLSPITSTALPTSFPTKSSIALVPSAPPTSKSIGIPSSTPTNNMPTSTVTPTDSPSEVKKEGRYAKFALRYYSNENYLLTKTCNWLQKRPNAIKRKYCRNKKYQLYYKDIIKNNITNYLPASRICFETCSSYCVEQRSNALFIVGTTVDINSGKENVKLRQCKWLQVQTQDVIDETCKMEKNGLGTGLNDNIMYGVASDVCTEICVSDKSCSGGG